MDETIEDLRESRNRYRKECQAMAKQLNDISEMVLGYREGRFGEVIRTLQHLKIKAMKHEANTQVEQLLDLIDDLSAAKQNILDDT